MRPTPTALAIALLAAATSYTTARAQLPIGGHNETSASMGAVFSIMPWTPTPGALGSVTGGPHIVISEIAVGPTGSEFIEICNPTPVPVPLDQVYLSDDWSWTSGVGYFLLPTPDYTVTPTTDFTMKFPAGSIILPGQSLVIAVDGVGFRVGFGFGADFELLATDPDAPDMINVGNNVPGAALLSNYSEFLVLFSWDGISDLTCDIDYVCWQTDQTLGTRIDKTGIAVDGPDADDLATPYQPDTPIASQQLAVAPPAGSSIQLEACDELPEATPGNGCAAGPDPTTDATWGRLKATYR